MDFIGMKSEGETDSGTSFIVSVSDAVHYVIWATIPTKL